MLRIRIDSGLHGQVDFCAHPLLIMFCQDGAHQPQAARQIRKQGGDPLSTFDLLVQALHTLGGSQ